MARAARTCRLTFPATEEEKRLLQHLAKEEGISLSAFIRRESLRGEAEGMDEAELAEAVATMKKVGDELHSIVEASKEHGPPPDDLVRQLSDRVAEVVERIVEVRTDSDARGSLSLAAKSRSDYAEPS